MTLLFSSTDTSRPSLTDMAPIYRHCRCARCATETWHEWHIGHRWTCACGAVRVENVWNHHGNVEQRAPVQLALQGE